MPFQTLPRSADRYSREQRAEIGAAVSAVRRLWGRMSDDFDASWAQVRPSMLAVATLAQERVAYGAVEYIPEVLAETGQPTAAYGAANPSRLVGVTGDGRPVESLLYGAVIRARQALKSPVPTVDDLGDPVGWERTSVPQALQVGSRWLTIATGTLLSDTGRAAEKVAMVTHKVDGYVRMLVPPSCSRCAIQAGRKFKINDGFQRHPRCDCRHVPASESVANDLTVDTRAYFDSLSEAEQNRIFTNEGAEAIRDGADINKTVNARRYLEPAQGRKKPGAREMPESIIEDTGVSSYDLLLERMKAGGFVR